MRANLTRTNEGGSVVSFIVIGFILVAVVIGGIYAVQKQGQNTKPAPGPVASSSAPATPPVVTAPTSAPPGSTTPPPTIKPTQPSQTTPPKPSSAPKSQPMPSTGPSDYIPGGFMIAVLAAAAIGYVNSRRELQAVSSEVD